MTRVLALLLLAAPAAWAARPFVTDDARVVDPGGCQVETVVKRQREFREREYWLLPACNPSGAAELTLGAIRTLSEPAGNGGILIAQGKFLLKPLETNGAGFALSFGAARLRPDAGGGATNPYFNAIGSHSLADDRVVLHGNLGALRNRALDRTIGTWGAGAEVLLQAPRLYGIAEVYGQRLEKPTVHFGVRYWIVANRLQVDATAGRQHASPSDRSFNTVGLRVLW